MPDFDDPFKPSDATVMRPRPGAGRRGSPDAATPMTRHALARAARGATRPDSRRGVRFARDRTEPAVAAASPLLLLAGQLRGTLSAPEVGGLRRHALDEIRRFEAARAGRGHHDAKSSARRATRCAPAIDEAVLSTPWGAQSEWAQQTLLVALHREAWGGEKFFEMLDKHLGRSRAPHRPDGAAVSVHRAGFAGKYQAMPQGQSRLADVQQELYRTIRDFRGTPRTELSIKWKGVEDRRNPLIRYVPWWVVGAAALAILAVTFESTTHGLAVRPVPCRARWPDWASKAFRSRFRWRRWPAPRSSNCSHPRSRTAA